MLNVGPRPRDDLMSAYVGQVDDWDLVHREANHRMKNTLLLLAASVRRDFKRAKIDELSAAVDRFERRIAAFGQLYHLLSGGEDVEGISVAGFFEPLCEALSETILEPAGIRCEAAIEDGKLCATQGRRLGLIVYELVTNAAKHAFPDKKGGLIRVEAVNRKGCWRFAVTDNGCGATGSLQGTGGRILEGLARSIGAALDCQSCQGGTRATIVVPARI
jgi:two-component sensor histidine kinase